ncbi:MAG: histidine phosphatase family protein [Tissierellaceae bacterium]|nr:histidine phosphatase family protein [Tissierellaceae bacterium]
MDIIMVRHGESEDNVVKVFSRHDIGLTEKGKSQILDAKARLSRYNFEKVYFSPFDRTIESLDILGLQGSLEPRIREINFGIFTGKTYEEILEMYPSESKAWLDDTNNYRIPEGESLLDVYIRVVDFLEEALKTDEDVLLVTHDCVIRLALCWVFDEMDYFFKFKIDNGSITVISIDNKFKFIKSLNN